MRMLQFCVAAITIAVAGCTVKETVVKPAVPAPPAVVYQQQPATARAPRIAFTIVTESQLSQAATQATTWCDTNRFGPVARLIDRRRSISGDVVTFECSQW